MEIQEGKNSVQTSAQGWRKVRLSELCEQIADCPHSTPLWTDSGVIVLRNQNIRNGRLDLSSPSYTDEAHYEQRSRRARLKAGDLVLTREAPMGEVCIVPEGLRCCLGQRMVMLRPDPAKCDPRFLLYSIQSDAVQHEINFSEGTGSTVSNLRIPHLEALSIPQPSLKEQKAIALILSSLDDKIELNRRMNATLEAMARALFKAWFVDFEPVHANQENRPSTSAYPEIAKLFPSDFDNGIPKGWEEKPLTEFFRLIGGGTPKTSVPEFWNGNIPWYSVVDAPNQSDVFVIDTVKKITRAGLTGSSASLLRKGVTIISARGTVGKLAIAGSEMTMNQSCYAVEGKFGDYFNFYVLEAAITELKQKTHGAVFDTITQDTFKSINQVLSNPKVITAFESSVEPMMRKIEENLRQNRTLSDIRDSLLPRLVSGKLRAGSN